MNLVKTSYKARDVKILLEDIKGKVPILGTEEREKLNQQGVHYSEMLPIEYEPTEEYMGIYQESLESLTQATADAVVVLSKRVQEQEKEGLVLVSLARAGTPVGVLVKRYIEKTTQKEVPHYSVSIVRGKGIDKVALKYIVKKHGARGIQFIDGWVGKGAINKELEQSCKELELESGIYKGLDSSIGVLSDPASVTNLYGTREDFLIPSACLNATVSGLISRTVHKEGVTGQNSFHGAIYYEEYESIDQSNKFIDLVESHFREVEYGNTTNTSYKGIDEVREISKRYGIEDINKIKPGIGETTRVVLRRVPERVLIRPGVDEVYIKHIKRLCKEKGIKIDEYPLKKYNVVGIIKDIADL